MLTVRPGTAKAWRRSSALTLVPVKRIREAGKPAARAARTSFGETASIQDPASRRVLRMPGLGLAFIA